MAYAARLREKALKCEFHDIDERILEHIIQKTTNAELVRQVLHKQWTLQQTLAEMQLLENTSEQAKAMGQHETQEVAKINRRKSKNKNKMSQNEQNKEQDIRCKYCDRTHPRQKELCPAYGETTVAYAARLREKALKCEFHDIDERILEHIIQKTTNAELVRQVLHKQWTLQQTLAEMQLLENTSEQAKAMGQHETQEVAKINRRKSKNKNKMSQNEQNKEQDIRCKYCDRTHPRQKELCPAYGKFCSKCGRPNHFSTVCMSVKEESKNLQKGNRNRIRRPRYGRDVKRTINDSDTDYSDNDLDQEPDFIDESVRHLTVGKIKVSKVSDLEKLFRL